ncbi:MAG TPA: hypothetical protein VNJ12_09290 [Candidatus Dormibacteraeota bacterium]|nr:hypothetical protein [Candidatus Dormibacteraeota bacterium]
MTHSRLDELYIGGGALAAVGAGILIRRLRKCDPEEIERRRRERVDRIGRLAQCEILDIVEGEPVTPAATKNARSASLIPPAPAPPRLLVVYRYTISRVSYETTQDFAQPSAGNRLPVPGQVVSIKYDPANPSNSILVTRSWPKPDTGPSKPAVPEKGK